MDVVSSLLCLNVGLCISHAELQILLPESQLCSNVFAL
jgi:hypothetical protein